MNAWHPKTSGAFYADDNGKVLGRVRPGLDTHFAESGNRELGEFISADAAKRAVERFFTRPEESPQSRP